MYAWHQVKGEYVHVIKAMRSRRTGRIFGYLYEDADGLFHRSAAESISFSLRLNEDEMN